MFNFSLTSVELNITDYCTHHCPYCYVSRDENSPPNHAQLNTLFKVIDEIAKTEVNVIALLGGDPAKHPQIVEILDYIKSKQKPKTALISNTLAIKNCSLEKLSQVVDSIDVTIHGRYANEHDVVCQSRGVYDSITRKMQLLSELGVEVNIVINIIPDTYNKIFEIAKGVIDQGVKLKYLLTQRIVPFGRAENSKEFNITKNQLDIAFEQIIDVEEKLGLSILVEDPYPLCCISEKYWKYMRGCPEGRVRMPIDGNGNVSRCGAVNDYSMGNILVTPLKTIWENSIEFNSFRENKHLINNDKCCNCILLEKCGGGCPVSCEIYNKLGIDFIKEFGE
ncbi:MAG: hypothetical protein CVV52_04645 [Spirochaetae bacterium HGW-Spirochaetae-8]|nr:MAG: hypothetical protein CVV52_04645 [Spirochaetae bacterium HGW-Spirochaetae-8]